ncbi:MAG TPA: helix-turn-helix transcriptional regulator [Candidatus Pelethousia gallinarum]|nr:helix-turn-helix transcriptional regulator [Candidatus Pelethousia gallinarum]
MYKYQGRCNASGENVRRIREGKKLSQEQLAAWLQLEGLSINQKAISRIETGERVVADYELLYLAKVLRVRVEDLLGMD